MTAPNPSPSGGRDRPHRVESLAVDPTDPGVREFLFRATLEGVIRTIATGRGRVLVLPSDLWPDGGTRPGGAGGPGRGGPSD